MDVQKWLMTSQVLVGPKREPIFMVAAIEKCERKDTNQGGCGRCTFVPKSEKQLSDIMT